MDTWVSGQPGGLSTVLDEGGANLSVGQRQLLCLSRAILRGSKVLIMDEVSLGVSGVTSALVALAASYNATRCPTSRLRVPSAVMCCEQATASIDPEADARIQATVREVFADCTVLTIAHRLPTIIDANKVLVMDAGYVAVCGCGCGCVRRCMAVWLCGRVCVCVCVGWLCVGWLTGAVGLGVRSRVLEFDSPANLLRNPAGAFTAMVEQTGPAAAQFLRQAALEAEAERSNSSSGAWGGRELRMLGCADSKPPAWGALLVSLCVCVPVPVLACTVGAGGRAVIQPPPLVRLRSLGADTTASAAVSIDDHLSLVSLEPTAPPLHDTTTAPHHDAEAALFEGLEEPGAVGSGGGASGADGDATPAHEWLPAQRHSMRFDTSHHAAAERMVAQAQSNRPPHPPTSMRSVSHPAGAILPVGSEASHSDDDDDDGDAAQLMGPVERSTSL